MYRRERMHIFYGTRLAWSEVLGRLGERAGDRSIVFLHGSPGTRNEWERVTSYLNSCSRMFLVDRPGYGLSVPVSPSATSIESTARSIASLIELESPQGAIVVGYSHGGGIASWLAITRPSLVRGLVLIASIGSPRAILPSDLLTATPIIGEMLCFTLIRLLAPREPAVLARLIPPFRPWSAEFGRLLHAAVASPGTWRTYLHEVRSMIAISNELYRGLALIQAPTLVIAGSEDKLVPPKASLDLATSIPNGSLREISGAGHLILVERPAELASLMDEFIATSIATDGSS